MRNSVIILTHGWAGSSLFTGLIARAGYWLGDDTVEKIDYNTNENAELVALNRRMLEELGYRGDYEHEFSDEVIAQLAEAGANLDMAPYQAFLEKCEAKRPWIWKDPRLTWTIRVWHRILPMDRVDFVILTREDLQAWVTSNLRRHIQSRRFTRAYNGGITRSLREFLDGNGQPHVDFAFEELLLEPEKTLERLNGFLGTTLDMGDLQAVCRQPLYRRSRGLKDLVMATLIYLKNYPERYA